MKKKNRAIGKKKGDGIKDGEIPGTVAGQNLGPNSKKEGLGPNGYR